MFFRKISLSLLNEYRNSILVEDIKYYLLGITYLQIYKSKIEMKKLLSILLISILFVSCKSKQNYSVLPNNQFVTDLTNSGWKMLINDRGTVMNFNCYFTNHSNDKIMFTQAGTSQTFYHINIRKDTFDLIGLNEINFQMKFYYYKDTLKCIISDTAYYDNATLLMYKN